MHVACGRGANLSLKSESAGLRMLGTWANKHSEGTVRWTEFHLEGKKNSITGERISWQNQYAVWRSSVSWVYKRKPFAPSLRDLGSVVQQIPHQRRGTALNRSSRRWCFLNEGCRTAQEIPSAAPQAWFSRWGVPPTSSADCGDARKHQTRGVTRWDGSEITWKLRVA